MAGAPLLDRRAPSGEGGERLPRSGEKGAPGGEGSLEGSPERGSAGESERRDSSTGGGVSRLWAGSPSRGERGLAASPKGARPYETGAALPRAAGCRAGAGLGGGAESKPSDSPEGGARAEGWHGVAMRAREDLPPPPRGKRESEAGERGLKGSPDGATRPGRVESGISRDPRERECRGGTQTSDRGEIVALGGSRGLVFSGGWGLGRVRARRAMEVGSEREGGGSARRGRRGAVVRRASMSS